MRILLSFLLLLIITGSSCAHNKRKATELKKEQETIMKMETDIVNDSLPDTNQNMKDQISIALSERFQLRQSETGVLAKEGLSVEVLNVRDNRCPPEVNCIRAGEVEIDVLLKNGTTQEEKTLTYPTREKRGSVNSIEFDGHVIEFIGASARKGSTSTFDLKPTTGDLQLNFTVTPIKPSE